MKYGLAALLCLACILLLYKVFTPRGESQIEKIRWKLDKSLRSSGSSRNCTFSSCADSGRCALNTSHISVFIQPLLEIFDENDRLLSPIPSREFLEIRRALLPFSVEDPQFACLSFPGVDFLNFDRFRTEDDVVRIVSALKMKLPNVVVVNFLGKAPFLNVMMVSSLPPRGSFRQQYDLSIPLFLPQTAPSGSTEMENTVKKGILLAPLLHLSSGKRQEIRLQLEKMGQNLTVISECPTESDGVCDLSGKVVDMDALIKSHRFVLLDDASPLFPHLLSQALRDGTIPVLFADSIVLPFADSIDWAEYALSPSSISRISEILARMRVEEIEMRSKKCRHLYRKSFSSPTAVIESVVYELERKLLPFSVGERENKCLPLLPHISPAPSLCSIVVAGDSSVLRRVSTLCRIPTISKIVVLWTSSGDPPPAEEWNCKKTPVDVAFGAGISSIPAVARASPQCQAFLFLPENGCDFKERNLVDATALWQGNPQALVHLPEDPSGTEGGETCKPGIVLHSVYLSQCLETGELDELNRLGMVRSLPSIHSSGQEVVSGRGAVRV